TLPFSTVGDPSGTRYLISTYAVSYASSCSSLLFLTERKASSRAKGLLAFANPLYHLSSSVRKGGKISPASLMKNLYESQGFDLDPLDQSEQEVKSIAAFFPKGKKDVYVSGEASEEKLKQTALENYEVIHFACHAYEDDRVPFRSGLFLSLHQGQEEDGFLQAREIGRLRMNAGLIVLSACRSSGGHIEPGEGTMGLPRVFFYAGAQSVLSSLWEVSDLAAVELMRRFYSYLGQKKSKAQALRLAKLSMLESRYAHPFYWAAFVLHGEPFSQLSSLE
ncbi:MAG: CHAT domain-containing protein, partial [Acidobacteriota bacterium]